MAVGHAPVSAVVTLTSATLPAVALIMMLPIASGVGNGAGIAWLLAIVGSLIILKICDMTVGLRVTKQQETDGLDLSMHGEEGYIFEA